jgi:hypothetical protein
MRICLLTPFTRPLTTSTTITTITTFSIVGCIRRCIGSSYCRYCAIALSGAFQVGGCNVM